MPRTVADRVLLGCLATPFSLLFGALFVGSLLLEEWPQGWLGWVVHLVVVDGLFVLAALGALAVLWAVAAPRVLEELIQTMARRTMFLISMVLLATVVAFVFAVFHLFD